MPKIIVFKTKIELLEKVLKQKSPYLNKSDKG